MTTRAFHFRGPDADAQVRDALAGIQTRVTAPIIEPLLDAPVSPGPDIVGEYWFDVSGLPFGPFLSPFGKPGNTIWLQEAWGIADFDGGGDAYGIAYRADDYDGHLGEVEWPSVPVRYQGRYGERPTDQWRSSTQMPRWASRTEFKVIGVTTDVDPYVWVCEFKLIREEPA